MAAKTTAQAGNWSNSSTWTGGVVASGGDTVTINHNVAVDTDTIVGTSSTAGTIAVQIGSSKILTVNSGVTFTVRGDTRLGNGVLVLGPGSTYKFDSSLAAGTPNYKIRFGDASNQINSKIICSGLPNLRTTITTASGSANGLIGRFANGLTAWTSINAAYTDFSNLGKTSSGYDASAIDLNPAGSGMEIVFTNCNFTNCGAVESFGCLASNNVIFSGCLFDSGIESAAYDIKLLTATSTSGARILRNNVFYSKSTTRVVLFSTSIQNYILENNAFGTLQYTAISSNEKMANCENNLFLQRSSKTGHLGEPDSYVVNNYLVGDTGGEHGYLSVPAFTTGSGGRCTYDSFVYENTSNTIDSDLSQALLPTVPITIKHIRGLALPNAGGYMCGNHTAHGNANTTLEYEHNTMCSRQPGGGTGDGAFYNGSSYAGHSGMIAYCKSNLIWAKSVPAQDGWIIYDAASSVANVVLSAGLDYNATYNLNSGVIYDASGGNGQNKKGYQGFRLSNQSIGTHDVTLPDGSNEQTEGPKFRDPFRYFAVFDSSYLGNTAPAWENNTAYAVGDIVSASHSGFYGGLSVNYRCVTAHTSLADNVASGQPGVVSSFRNNWELASHYRIREALLADTRITDADLGLTNASYIDTLHTWVREGWRPTAIELSGVAHDGGTIGALELYVAPPSGGAGGGSGGITDVCTFARPQVTQFINNSIVLNVNQFGTIINITDYQSIFPSGDVLAWASGLNDRFDDCQYYQRKIM